jgi:hypothetical protein
MDALELGAPPVSGAVGAFTRSDVETALLSQWRAAIELPEDHEIFQVAYDTRHAYHIPDCQITRGQEWERGEAGGRWALDWQVSWLLQRCCERGAMKDCEDIKSFLSVRVHP